MDWNDEMIARLGALWNEGLSTAEIGRQMGITKNAVVGKAHRLNLKPRPSPIRWATGTAASPVAATASATAHPRARPAAPSSRFHSVFHPGVASKPGPRTSPCCWPIGEPGTPSFRFCDADAAAGRPYCVQHAQLAYVKVRDRREEAA